MSPRTQTLVAAGALVVVVAGVVIAGLVARTGPEPGATSVVASVASLEDAVALGLLDQEVVDELRADGAATAIVHLDTAAIIDALRRTLGEARADELIAGMSAAFAANKDLIRRALGPAAAVIRDYEHLGAFVVTVTSEEALLAALRSGLVREIAADTAVEPTRGGPEPVTAVPRDLGLSQHQGAGVFVGVLDTGVDAAAFPEYFPAGSVVDTFEAAPPDFAPDDHGHGTHVSSTVLLVAPQARLYVADVFHMQPLGPGSSELANLASDSNTLAGMDWLIGLRRSGVDLRAVNISLGSGHFPPGRCVDRYHLAEAVAAGIVPVGSAGNLAFIDDEGQQTTTYQRGIGSTGCDPSILSVGAASNGSCLDGAVDTVAEFSQSSEALDMLAPGMCIVAAGGVKSGTSMAAPHVAGAVAALASAREATVGEIWGALVSTGPPITDPNSGITRRRLDLPTALAALLSGSPLPTPEIVASRGVALSHDAIAPQRELSPGEAFELDSVLIRNTGTVSSTYRMVVGAPDSLLEVAAPASWISVQPSSIALGPGELGFVFTELLLPVDAAPGDYAALLTAVDDAALASERGTPVRLTFTVRSSGAGGGETEPAGGGGSGGVDDAAPGWLDDPVVLGVGAVLVLLVLWRASRRRPATR